MKKALCANPDFDPEWWFPRPLQNIRTIQAQAEIKRAILALSICNRCPLMANGECLDYSLKDEDLTKHGISAGLLPDEKRRLIGIKYNRPELYLLKIRELATKAGIPAPTRKVTPLNDLNAE